MVETSIMFRGEVVGTIERGAPATAFAYVVFATVPDGRRVFPAVRLVDGSLGLVAETQADLDFVRGFSSWKAAV